MTQVMTVFEHQTLKLSDFVFKSDFQWLIDQDYEVFTSGRQQGQWIVTVRQYIGVVRLPSGIILEILPKIVSSARHEGSNSASVASSRRWVQRMLEELTYPERKSPAAYRENSHHSKLKSPATLISKQLGQSSEHVRPYTAAVPPLSEWLLNQFLALFQQYQPTNQYQTQQQNNANLQGKLLIKEQLQRNVHQPHRFVSEVSEFATSSLSNRMIQQGWQQLYQIVFATQRLDINARESQLATSTSLATDAPSLVSSSLSQTANYQSFAAQQVARQWRDIGGLSRFECQRLEATYTEAKRELKSAAIAPQRRQIGFQLLALAYWLLSSTQQRSAGVVLNEDIQESSLHRAAHGSAREESLCLFINMNHAFETWVSRKVAQRFNDLDPRYVVQFQVQRPWLVDDVGQTCMTMVPDILIHFEGEPSHIIDIKWKTIRHSRDMTASDAYQLISYGVTFGVKQVWLIYPSATSQPCSKLSPQFPNNSELALEIWLIPFNIETGTVESWPMG